MPALRVLLVEDNPGDADLVRDALEQIGGVEVAWVMRLHDALARVTGAPPDVLLLDLDLPDASGLQGLERVRRASPQLPVVVLTGSMDTATGPLAVAAGAQDYLVKGRADGELLLRTLRYAVERQKLWERTQLLARAQAAHAAAEEARRRAQLLAEIGTALWKSLDYQTTLAAAARLPVPGFADGCVVEVTEEDAATGGRVAAYHVGAEDAVFADVRERHAPGGAGDAVLTGRAVLLSDAEGDLGARLPYADLLAAVGSAARSAIVVPLITRRHSVGLVTFVLASSGRRYADEDLLLAEEIGRRAAAALEHARLYREAQAAIAVRNEFLSVAAHELRTPLSVLQLQLEMATRRLSMGLDAEGVPLLARYLERSTRQMARLADLVNSLLDVARLGAGGPELHREDTDLVGLARTLVERLADQAARVGSPLEFEATGPVMGHWDRLALERVLSNLLSNALKYGAGQPVTVVVAAAGDSAVVRVIDRGIGIPPEDLRRIFERFERAVNGRHYGGLGLGLYIARQLVEAHGGRIEVASRPGHGATFTAWLPRSPTAALAEQRP